MSSINIWDDRAGLQSCWFECEDNPTSAYSFPSKDGDFLYLTGYRYFQTIDTILMYDDISITRDEASKAEWFENVLFFSCLSGCRSQLKAERWFYILVPSLSALVLFILLCCCISCKGCPLARWWRDTRTNSAKVLPKPTPPPNPFLVSSIADFDTGYGYTSLGFHSQPAQRRRISTLDRK